VVFRSLLVPLKAAIMNLLSIAAAYGVIVAIFQWGWLKGLVGLDETVPIVSFVPMMMFAILFGLSMDYEVFLLSRIREEYYESKDNLRSVIDGLAATARVITSAALIMISVFLSFVGNPDPTVKMFGVGLAVAVFVDATIVRLVLVPATMELLGAANWWLPGWLGRILPRIRIEEGVPTPVSVPRRGSLKRAAGDVKVPIARTVAAATAGGGGGGRGRRPARCARRPTRARGARERGGPGTRRARTHATADRVGAPPRPGRPPAARARRGSRSR
jgi:MMPL family